MGASLDRISGGRFAINVVNGWYEEEFEIFGNGGWLDRAEARYRRMGEFVDVLKGLWTEEVFTHRGAFYRCDSGRLPIRPVQLPHPPIYAASRSEAGKEVVARACDVWFMGYEPGYASADANLAGFAADIEDLDRRSDSYGRSLSYGISAHVICTESAGEAEERVAELEEYGARDPVSAAASKPHSVEGAKASSTALRSAALSLDARKR
jgi:FMNH2-dependent dimethyl sulfone monooxygenase